MIRSALKESRVSKIFSSRGSYLRQARAFSGDEHNFDFKSLRKFKPPLQVPKVNERLTTHRFMILVPTLTKALSPSEASMSSTIPCGIRALPSSMESATGCAFVGCCPPAG